MSRYIGPKWRINRRENASVLGATEKWRKRTNPPGDAAAEKGGGRLSEYGTQLREKQKVKRMFGLNENQFRRFYRTAQKSTGNTGTRILQLLELRADNIVYRLGFAKTRAQARQMVTHGHILMNGKKHNIPSSIVPVGAEISVKPKIASTDAFKITATELATVKVPAWLEKLSNGGKVVAEPLRDQMDPTIKERLIVEYYSKFNV